MPTNLYGPNDNFDLEKSHVLPALIRKILLGKALENANWDYIKNDLNKLPIKGIDGAATQDTILKVLNEVGITVAKDNVHVEIWGSGKPKREFLWSEDMADACVFIMNNSDFKDVAKDLKEVRNTHINIGTGEDISIKELAILIKDIVGFKGELVFNTEKPDGTLKKVTDVSKLNGLGWKHSTALKDGIEKMYDWYMTK